MNKKAIYNQGYQTGYDIAERNRNELWEVYDNGVFDGILQLVKEETNLLQNNHE